MPLAIASAISPVAGPAAVAYTQKILSLQPADLIAYWPLYERSGTDVDNLEGTAARDGSYTGVTLADAVGPFGTVAPFFDGVNDYADLYTTSFRDAFDGDEGTIMLWVKMADWTAAQYMLDFEVNNSNEIVFANPVNDTLQIKREAAGVADPISVNPITTTDWIHLAITYSVAADEVKAYLDGSQEGSTLTGLQNWSGNLASTRTAIGASDITTPSQPAEMHAAHCAVWTAPLSATKIAQAAAV